MREMVDEAIDPICFTALCAAIAKFDQLPTLDNHAGELKAVGVGGAGKKLPSASGLEACPHLQTDHALLSWPRIKSGAAKGIDNAPRHHPGLDLGSPNPSNLHFTSMGCTQIHNYHSRLGCEVQFSLATI